MLRIRVHCVLLAHAWRSYVCNTISNTTYAVLKLATIALALGKMNNYAAVWQSSFLYKKKTPQSLCRVEWNELTWLAHLATPHFPMRTPFEQEL